MSRSPSSPFSRSSYRALRVALALSCAGLRGVISYFRRSLGVPAPLTVLAALTECFGGLVMIVGVLVRPAAVGLIIVMLVGIATMHWRHGFFLNWSLEPGKGHGFEMNVALIGMALAVLVGGGGSGVGRPVDPALVDPSGLGMPGVRSHAPRQRSASFRIGTTMDTSGFVEAQRRPKAGN